MAIPVVVSGCGRSNTGSNVEAPAAAAGPKTAALEACAKVLQGRPPVEAINAYLNGFHFYSGRPEGQMEAHHYCSILNEEVIPCVMYDGTVLLPLAEDVLIEELGTLGARMIKRRLQLVAPRAGDIALNMGRAVSGDTVTLALVGMGLSPPFGGSARSEAALDAASVHESAITRFE